MVVFILLKESDPGPGKAKGTVTKLTFGNSIWSRAAEVGRIGGRPGANLPKLPSPTTSRMERDKQTLRLNSAKTPPNVSTSFSLEADAAQRIR
eukprot:453663-Rhodomonas_salina.1